MKNLKKIHTLTLHLHNPETLSLTIKQQRTITKNPLICHHYKSKASLEIPQHHLLQIKCSRATTAQPLQPIVLHADNLSSNNDFPLQQNQP
jgi:hypothetical protein